MDGQALRSARLRIGETQEQFCIRLGVDQTTLSKWETNGLPRTGPGRMLLEKVLTELLDMPSMGDAPFHIPADA